MRFQGTGLAVGLLMTGAVLPACGAGPRDSVRLGYFPNLTHAAAMVGVERGYFQAELGPAEHLRTQTFSAGPPEVEALFSGAIDIGFLGPGPAINAYVKSGGDAIRVVGGAASGGAALVVRAGLDVRSAVDLRGRTIATPGLGNTQDVALRTYLLDHGLKTSPEGGGDVRIVPTENATALQLFKQGQLDGAWLPEPWATRLVVEASGRVLVDERELWPGGRFSTTLVVASRRFLADHPTAVRAILRGELAALEWISSNPSDARTLVNRSLKSLTGKSLSRAAIDAAWKSLTFTSDPLATTLRTDAADAVRVSVAGAASIDHLLDLRILDALLLARGQPALQSAGLGPE